jgi:hypothetical protein
MGQNVNPPRQRLFRLMKGYNDRLRSPVTAPRSIHKRNGSIGIKYRDNQPYRRHDTNLVIFLAVFNLIVWYMYYSSLA